MNEGAMSEGEFAAYADKWVASHKDEIVSTLLELIRIPSVGEEPEEGKPFGPKVHEALTFFKEKAAGFGMIVKDVEGYAAHAEIGTGHEIVMALTHVDVVPLGTGWTRNPLGEVFDGKVFGRGAQDNKGPTVACLYALRILKESGVRLSRRVRHVVGGNEESGFRCVRKYFEVEEKPTYGFSPDAYFPLVYAEKGNMNAKVTCRLEKGPLTLTEVSGGERPNIVPEKARAVLEVPEGFEEEVIRRLESAAASVRERVGGPVPIDFQFEKEPGKVMMASRGRACHASTPWAGTNALAGLLHLLASLGPDLGSHEALRFAADAAQIYGKGLNIEAEDDISGKLTCNLGVAATGDENGHRLLSCIYNIRYPVRASGEELKMRVLSCDKPQGVSLEVLSLGKSHYTDPDSHLVKTLLRVYREETGDNSPPMAIGGGTYAKVIPGGVAYGPVRPGQPETAHQADEYLSLEDLFFLVKIYARALFAIAGL